MSFQRVPITVVDVRLNDASDESFAEFQTALDQIGVSFDAPLPLIETVIDEDEIDRALRNAKDEVEFDAIYTYSGRPVADSWHKEAEKTLAFHQWVQRLRHDPSVVLEEDE